MLRWPLYLHPLLAQLVCLAVSVLSAFRSKEPPSVNLPFCQLQTDWHQTLRHTPWVQRCGLSNSILCLILLLPLAPSLPLQLYISKKIEMASRLVGTSKVIQLCLILNASCLCLDWIRPHFGSLYDCYRKLGVIFISIINFRPFTDSQKSAYTFSQFLPIFVDLYSDLYTVSFL